MGDTEIGTVQPHLLVVTDIPAADWDRAALSIESSFGLEAATRIASPPLPQYNRRWEIDPMNALELSRERLQFSGPLWCAQPPRLAGGLEELSELLQVRLVSSAVSPVMHVTVGGRQPLSLLIPAASRLDAMGDGPVLVRALGLTVSMDVGTLALDITRLPDQDATARYACQWHQDHDSSAACVDRARRYNEELGSIMSHIERGLRGA